MSLFQYYMLIFLLIYFGLIVGWRSYLLYRNTKINPLKNFGKKTSAATAERWILIASGLMLIIGLNFCFVQGNYQYFYPIEINNFSWLSHLGFALSMAGLTLTFTAQLQMKDSWRLGLDDQNKVTLVTSGLFQYSRNPIYLGLGVAFTGFLLIAPNWGSVLFIVIMMAAISRKIKDEEAYLREKIPQEYSEYLKKVNRWI